MADTLTPDNCAEELARLFDAQSEICGKILDLSRKQQTLVEQRKEDELLVLLSDKQRLIDSHQQLSAKSHPLREKWDTARNAASPAAHAKVEKSWNNLRAVLDDIVKLEDASRAMLQEQHGKLSDDLGKIQRGRIANKAYGGGVRVPPTARYSDKKG